MIGFVVRLPLAVSDLSYGSVLHGSSGCAPGTVGYVFNISVFS